MGESPVTHLLLQVGRRITAEYAGRQVGFWVRVEWGKSGIAAVGFQYGVNQNHYTDFQGERTKAKRNGMYF